jgi:hypothetical protein
LHVHARTRTRHPIRWLLNDAGGPLRMWIDVKVHGAQSLAQKLDEIFP